MKLSRVVVIVAVTAAIVYFGLNFLLPNGKNQKAEKAETAATTTEAVFGSAPGETATAAPADAGPAPAAEAAATDTSSTAEPAALTEEEARKIAESVGREVAERVANEAAAPAPSAEPEPAAAPIETAAAAPEAAPAPAPSYEAAPAPVETASTAASDEPSGLTDAQARAIAANIARENLAGGAVDTAPVSAPEPVVETAAAPAKPEKKVEKKKEPEAAAPAPSYETAAASSEPAAPRKPKASKPASVAMPKAAAKAPGVGSDAVSSWWPKAGTQSADRLALVYAGEAASEKAVVLMFGSTFSDAAAAGSQIKLVDAKGASPSGTWELGRNPRLLVFKGVTPGRYTVILKPTLADAAGKTLGTELVGPVYVH